MTALLAHGYLTGGDGTFDPQRADQDHLSGAGDDLDYAITPAGRRFLDDFGVSLQAGRPAVRYCIDWTEQRHHIAGALGRGILDRLIALDWIRRAPSSRAVQLTDAGHQGLNDALAIHLDRPRP
jgi:hypothetical protein